MLESQYANCRAVICHHYSLTVPSLHTRRTGNGAEILEINTSIQANPAPWAVAPHDVSNVGDRVQHSHLTGLASGTERDEMDPSMGRATIARDAYR